MLTCPLVGTFIVHVAVDSCVINRFNILPAAFFSIAEGGVMVGVAKISATVSVEGDSTTTPVPHFEFKWSRYCAACTGCWHSLHDSVRPPNICMTAYGGSRTP